MGQGGAGKDVVGWSRKGCGRMVDTYGILIRFYLELL